ncbi:MAG: hypothetical protein BZ138_05555 [Methanosphaera sp. rholeuAM270]|nr:MAG: hypothetical protein BZ138_05555 [Methanosphaera sp. rholeuAM270]
MKKSGVFYKVLNMFWIILVFIPLFNGLGFIYAGYRVKETRWVDEGIVYMIPFILISFTIYNYIVLYMIFLSWFVGIIRSFMIVEAFNEKLEDLNNVNLHNNGNLKIPIRENNENLELNNTTQDDNMDNKDFKDIINAEDKKDIGRRLDL